MNIKNFVGAAAFAVIGTSVNAATLSIDSGGQLLGASDVDVGGTLYDVSFADGTCAEVFGTCDTTSFDFAFDTTGAELASQALLDQVFQDSSSGNFDSTPALTAGCSLFVCGVFTPYFAVSSISSFSYLALNSIFEPVDNVINENLLTNLSTSDNDALVWARWSLATPSVPVPIPAGLPLLASALFAFGLLRRRNTAS